MKLTTKVITSVATIAVFVAAGSALARDQRHLMQGPMNEAAVTACQNQSEGASVTFNHPMWGNVNAVCAKTFMDDKLVAMPPKKVEHMKESKAACVGKKEGDSVALNSMFEDGKKIDAVCTKHGDVLAAHPKGMMGRDGRKPGHHGDGMM